MKRTLVTTMRQCNFIVCHTCTGFGDDDGGEAGRSATGSSAPSSHFCCEPKTPQKIKKKKKTKRSQLGLPANDNSKSPVAPSFGHRVQGLVWSVGSRSSPRGRGVQGRALMWGRAPRQHLRLLGNSPEDCRPWKWPF